MARAVFLLFMVLQGVLAVEEEMVNSTRVVTYFTHWGIYARNYQVKNILTRCLLARPPVR